MVVSNVGIPVVDSHAHFVTFATVKMWMETSQATMEQMEKRVSKLTDMEHFTIPDEAWDTGQMWIDEMEKYGISAVGMMINRESWDEFNDARRRFPGRFLGYAMINPADDDAVDQVERAGSDGFQGIKLYPSSWDFHAYDKRVYPIYEEALRNNLLVIAHFGITIGSQANLVYGNPLDIQKPAHDFPELNFMIAHFGAGFLREVLMLMYQTNNVHMDTSGSNSWMKYLPYDLTITKVFEKTLKAGGPCRVVFGTDSSFFPRGFRYNILEEQYGAVKALCPQLCYSEEDVDNIFRGNILRLTGFKPVDMTGVEAESTLSCVDY
ncbi:MAG: amidohydrolase family protein [Candidatus Thorarchaeota archaeon]|nr:MAG: amidohydrolase family protein [Candidatus Thorarchaeota archaeon]